MDIVETRGRKKKPAEGKKRQRAVYATDKDWDKIVTLAEEQGEEASPFVIKKALQGDTPA